jgi:hypothetical protein
MQQKGEKIKVIRYDRELPGCQGGSEKVYRVAVKESHRFPSPVIVSPASLPNGSA